MLDAEGIFTNIPDEHLAGIDWQMGTALHGIRLQVAPEDVDRATELLATAFVITDQEIAGPGVVDLPDVPEVGPACGSDAIGPPKWRNRLKAAGLFFPPLLLAWPIFAVFGADATCLSCERSLRRSGPAQQI